jgi:hypothetical protein
MTVFLGQVLISFGCSVSPFYRFSGIRKLSPYLLLQVENSCNLNYHMNHMRIKRTVMSPYVKESINFFKQKSTPRKSRAAHT